MGRLHPFSFILAVLIGIICLIMAVFSYAEDNIDREIKYWLRKAEEHANNIIDPNERDLGLFLLAAAHVHAENYEKAHSIVSEIDESKRKNYWPVSLMIQARAGDIQGAVKKAQTFKDQEIRSHCMYSVMYECIKKNIPYALEVIEKQPKPDQCSLYYMVVQEQVLQGKLEEARKTFRKISDPNSKSDANNWILTGQIVEQDDLAVAIAQAKNFTENPNYYIGRIIQRKIEAGKVIEAEEIIDNVPDSEVKVEGYIDLAEYYLRKDQKVLFEKYLHKAQRENEFVDRVFIAACHYWSIAKMYAEAGNWEAGLECAKKAENISSESFQEEYKSGKFPRPFYNDNYQLYRLMIYAGRLDEAFQVIISEGELLPIDITCMLTCSFAKDGNMEKLHVLIQLAKTEKEKFIICRSIVDGLIARKKEREENDK